MTDPKYGFCTTLGAALVSAVALGATPALAQAGCAGLPSHSELTTALKASVKPSGGPSNGGFDLNMWATVVNRHGEVCTVARTGGDPGTSGPATG